MIKPSTYHVQGDDVLLQCLLLFWRLMTIDAHLTICSNTNIHTAFPAPALTI